MVFAELFAGIFGGLVLAFPVVAFMVGYFDGDAAEGWASVVWAVQHPLEALDDLRS